MNHKFDSIKRTRVLLNLTLDRYHYSQDLEKYGEYESARYELAKAEKYADMYWHRTGAEERGAEEG